MPEFLGPMAKLHKTGRAGSDDDLRAGCSDVLHLPLQDSHREVTVRKRVAASDPQADAHTAIVDASQSASPNPSARMASPTT